MFMPFWTGSFLTVLMHVTPLTVPILRSTEHIRTTLLILCIQ
jgi:hypothetical protein